MDNKILLVNPTYKFLKMPRASLPLGLLNLGTILKNSGYDVKLIDINAEKKYGNNFTPNPLNPKEFLAKVKKYDPDIIGLSSYTQNYPIALKIAQLCKSENPNLKIVFGGIMATYIPDECLAANKFIDMVVKGEGEYVLLEIVKKASNAQEWIKIKNIAFRENGKIKHSSTIAPPDLNKIPVPDLDLIKDKHYPSFLLQLEFSRGCPYQCAFCCLSPFSRRKVRYFPVKRILGTLEAYKERFGNFSFSISDPLFLLNEKKVREFIGEIENRKIVLKEWLFQTRVDTINKGILLDLKKKNAHSCALGIEDIHDSVLHATLKTQTFSQIESAIKILKKLDYKIEANFMIGLPSQTKKDMLENIAYSKKLDFFSFPCVLPFPGTQICNQPERFGLSILTKDWELYTGREIVMESLVFPIDQQREVRNVAYQHLARVQLEDESLYYFEREKYERLLELGFEDFNEEWKKEQATGWN